MLTGKKALVTGAGRGIGKSIAVGFAQAGADVVVIDVDIKNAKKVTGDLEKYGINSKAIKTDVSNQNDVKKAL